MSALIRNVNAVIDGQLVETSILIADGKIVDIDPAAQTSADEVVDGGGKILIPGVVDDQVHFREPGLTAKEDLTHASRACAKGDQFSGNAQHDPQCDHPKFDR